MERSHSSALSVARASHDQETWSTVRGSLKETTIDVHQMWQELFHIRLRFMKGITLERSHSIAQSVARDFHYQETWSTIRRSWKETTIEVQQKWQELFHIRWRFMKGITQERSHSIAQSVARASQDQNTKKYHKRIHEGKNHWSLRSFSTSRFMKGMTMERNNSSAWSVARASHDQETWRDDQRIHEGNNQWSAPNVTGAFPHRVKIHEGNRNQEKPFNCTMCGRILGKVMGGG